MPSFQYTAISPTGELTEGVMEAPQATDVIARLRRGGSIPIGAKPQSASLFAGLTGGMQGRAGLARKDVAAFTRELSIMLAAGQDLDRALRFLIDTARTPRGAAVLTDMRDAVRDGTPLANALARHPRSFSRLYVGLVRAGEAGGQLSATLDRVALLLERQQALTSTITSAMIYPSLLILAAFGSITLLLTEVLPQFVPLFEQNGAALPTPTRILIATGDIVSRYGVAATVLSVAAAWLARRAMRVPANRMRVERVVMRLPVLGGLFREILAARFTRTLGTLLLNGVSLIAALGITREVMGSVSGSEAVEQAARSAKGGAGLWRPLQESGVFPIRAIYLLRLGEETAQLGAMALRAADIHEEKTRLAIQRLVSLLVPAITIVMGAAIAGIVSALLMAMLSLNDLAS